MKKTLLAIATLFALGTVSFTGCIDTADSTGAPAAVEENTSTAEESLEASGGVCGPLLCGPKTHGCNCACDNAACVPDGFECADVCIDRD